MNSTHKDCAAQGCAGCGTTTFEPGSSAITDDAGRYLGAACHRCTQDAADSPTVRRQIEMAAAIGVPLSEARRLFGSVGLPVPSTADEAVATMAAMMAMPGRA